MKTTLRADGVPSPMSNGHLPNISLDLSIHQPISSTFMECIVRMYTHATGYSTYSEVSCCVKLSFCVQWKSVKSAETLKSLENPLIEGFTVFSCKPYDSTKIHSQYYITDVKGFRKDLSVYRHHHHHHHVPEGLGVFPVP